MVTIQPDLGEVVKLVKCVRWLVKMNPVPLIPYYPGCDSEELELVFFFICLNKSSLKSTNCIEPLFLHGTVSDHTESSSVQDHKACNGVLAEAWHLTQRGSGDILLRNKALFVGMASRQARHNKVFTFGGTFIDQISLQNYLSSFVTSLDSTFSSSSSSSFKNLYPVLQLYLPSQE